MPQPLSEYFAQEAAEYLDRLDALLARPDAPDAVEFFRAARGVRGGAQIAGADGVARVAEGMEEAARGLRDGTLAWSEDVRRRAKDTAADLRDLVAAAGRWGPDEERRAAQAAARWDATGGGRRREPGHAGGQLYDFLRREIGGVVSELDRVIADLRASPTSREPLRGVLRRMRPVRGVAGMDDLSPVLELLEGIEDAAHEVLGRSGPVAAEQVDVLAAGRDALQAMGAAVERGGALGDTAELERFRLARERLEGEAEDDADVVAVATLFCDDGGPNVVSSPMAPAAAEPSPTLAQDIEGFLRIEATGFLDRAEGLVASLSSRPSRFARIARELRGLARGVGELAVTYGLTTIAQAADDAAVRIAQAASPEEARGALRRLRATLPGAAPLAESAVEVEQEPQAAPAPASPAAAVEDGVVPIDALVYAPEAALREALAMRDRVARLAGARDGTALAEALDELFGLVALGLERRAA